MSARKDFRRKNAHAPRFVIPAIQSMRQRSPPRVRKTVVSPHQQHALTQHLPPGDLNLQPMRVFGIDCSTEITGFGVVDSDDSGPLCRLVCKTSGAIRLLKTKTMS